MVLLAMDFSLQKGSRITGGKSYSFLKKKQKDRGRNALSELPIEAAEKSSMRGIEDRPC
jgi:hypothetical protein